MDIELRDLNYKFDLFKFESKRINVQNAFYGS